MQSSARTCTGHPPVGGGCASSVRVSTPCWATPTGQPRLYSMSLSAHSRAAGAQTTCFQQSALPIRLPSRLQQCCTSASVALRCGSTSGDVSCCVSCHQLLGQSQQRLVAAVRADQAESDRQPIHPREWQGDLQPSRWRLRLHTALASSAPLAPDTKCVSDQDLALDHCRLTPVEQPPATVFHMHRDSTEACINRFSTAVWIAITLLWRLWAACFLCGLVVASRLTCGSPASPATHMMVMARCRHSSRPGPSMPCGNTPDFIEGFNLVSSSQ